MYMHAWIISLVLVTIPATITYFSSDKCSGLVRYGKWVEQNWAPYGCMAPSVKTDYSESDMSCVANVTFVGDSIAREVFHALAKSIDPEIQFDASQRHANQEAQPRGIPLSFVWDPFANETNFDTMSDPVVLSTGLWYLRHPETGGVDSWKDHLSSLSESLKKSHLKKLIMLPPEVVIDELLSEDRHRFISSTNVASMNAYLESFNAPWLLMSAMNDYLQTSSSASDGLHFSELDYRRISNLVIQSQCNTLDHFPYVTTCCTEYPRPSLSQCISFLLLLALAASEIVKGLKARYGKGIPLQHDEIELQQEMELQIEEAHNRVEPSSKEGFPTTLPKLLTPVSDSESYDWCSVAAATALCFLFDRTHAIAKEKKQFDWTTVALAVLVSVFLYKEQMQPAKAPGFLNREQTDEWKGWMQLAILVYHYTGASKVSPIYNPIRVIVASYLFMTGYGHTTFFVSKNDFSLKRLASILFRLNLLTVILSYAMDANYLNYYFAPLVSFWFLVLWTTLRVKNSLNSTPVYIGLKCMISAGAVALLCHTRAFNLIFQALAVVFKTQWDAAEWRFRISLDLYIVWVGAFAALVKLKLSKNPPSRWVRRTAVAISGIVMALFVLLEPLYTKFEYNKAHPYLSPFVVVAFIVLRNSSDTLRSTSSAFFIWLGRCSLETFILQFHLFLAADTKGVATVLPGSYKNVANGLLVMPLFLVLSHHISGASNRLTSAFVNGPGLEWRIGGTLAALILLNWVDWLK